MTEALLCKKTSAKLAETALGSELLSVFEQENITTLFQPIVSLKRREIYAFECLTRGPENTPLYSPLNLFGLADDMGCLLQMDILARDVAIRNFASASNFHQNQAKLFINVTVSSLLDKGHRSGKTLSMLDHYSIDRNQVVIEITELQPIEDYDLFLNAVNHYRSMGFKVAIDDLGSGYNGLQLWSQVKPDYVKIDKHFVQGLDTNADKHRFVEALVILARGLGTQVVAEGVETEKELNMLINLGVDFVQGYLLKRPSDLPSLSLSYEFTKPSPSVTDNQENLSSIVKPCQSIRPTDSFTEVAEYLANREYEHFLPVVDDETPVGIVWRDEVVNILASKYGRYLHSRKPISRLMDDEPLIYDINASLVEVSAELTSMRRNTKSAFIITQNEKFIGCGVLVDLLKVMTDLKIESAKYANPLSGLPGNVPIQKQIQYCLTKQITFSVIYVDVDHFKPYNDCYSFEQGDQVISIISKVLSNVMAGKKGFIGHIGGDDFVIITTEPYEQVAQAVLDEFNHASQNFYTQEDREKGGIQALGRDGQPQFFPMMTLSLGILLVYPEIFDHTQKLSAMATRAKKGAKAAGGNQYFVVDSRDEVVV